MSAEVATSAQAPAQQEVPAKPHRLRWQWVVGLLLIVQGIVGLVGLLSSLGGHDTVREAPPLPRPVAQSTVATQATQAGTLSTATFSVMPPAGWRVLKQTSTSVALLGPNAEGSLYLASGKLPQPTTLVQVANEYLRSISGDSADAHVCVKATRQPVPAGPTGILVGVCQTVTPTNGQAFEGLDLVAIALNARGDVIYVTDFFTVAKTADLKRFLADAKPLIGTLQWKLR